MDINQVEKSIQYIFKNKDFLRNALTHPSYMCSNFENLEFIGDRVLGLCVADFIWQLSPANEKEYARLFTTYVGKESLYLVSLQIGLDKYIEWRGCASHTQTIFADACEAFLGALYLDSGFEYTKEFINKTWSKIKIPTFNEIDPKTILQNWVNQNNLNNPNYKLISENGAAHNKNYVVELLVGTKRAIGSGTSIRNAEKNAVLKFMQYNNIISKGVI